MSARTQAELSANSSAQQSRIPSVLLQRLHILILIYDDALRVRDALLRELAADHPSGQDLNAGDYRYRRLSQLIDRVQRVRQNITQSARDAGHPEFRTQDWDAALPVDRV